MRSLLVLAALVGCNGGGVEIGEDTDDTDVADTDTTDDTDDTDDTDAETDDTTDTFELGGTLDASADVAVPSGDVSVGLVHLVGNTFGDVLAQDEVSGLTAGGSVPFQLHLPDLEDDWYQPIDGTSAEVALFLVGAWQDTDGDDVPAEGDVFVGGSLTYVAHLRGELPTELTALGAELGWNLVVYDFAVNPDGPTEIVPLEDGYADYVLEANLLPVPQDDLPGEIVPSLGGTVGAGLLSVKEYFGGAAPADPTFTSIAVLANAANTTFVWSGPLGEPPEDHFSSDFGDGQDLGVDIAPYLGIAWSDADGDGDLDSTEVPRAISSDAGSESRMAMYLRARDFRAVYFPEVYGWNMGWMLVLAEEGGDPTPERWTDGLVLDVAR